MARIDRTPRVSPVWVEIYEQRVGQGWSLRGLAEEVGCDHNSLSRAERGLQSPPLEVVERVVEVLGCELVVAPLLPGRAGGGRRRYPRQL